MAGAREADPHIRAVLMPVIPNVRAAADAAFGAECERFNELLAKAVADLSTPASPLLLASEPAGWRDRRRHVRRDAPLAEPGEHLLAGAFAEAMHQAWGVGGRYAAPDGTRGPDASADEAAYGVPAAAH